ncbi:MAG: hypothetical protein IPL53_20725 [Ignavibacteria bacterium]|nr:hypothetical protein [Ignavibacteria bacterium]
MLLINILLLFPSLGIPFYGDDFAWLLQSKLLSSQSFVEFISSPAPFDYFRPLPKLFFYFISQELHGSHTLFRIVILILQITCSILVYKFTLTLNYSKRASVFAALIFSVLSCHSEALFFINCINEIFSAMFILTGLYLFTRYDASKVVIPVILTFLLALLSRESAICYIPLILLVKMKTGRGNWKDVILITLIPMMIYVAFRIFSETYYSGSNTDSMTGNLDLNPLKAIYKLFHYFINMIFPVKLLFEFTGYDFSETLIGAFRKPMENLTVFLALSVTIITIGVSVLVLLFKTMGKEIVFPLLFILFSLGIYLFSFSTAERFLYLPSAGFCILLAVFIDKLKNEIFAVIFLLMFLIIHSVSLFSREIRHKQAAYYSEVVMNDLYLKTSGIEAKSIFLESIPPKKYGIFFLSRLNLQPNWDYNFPDRKIKFSFYETESKAEDADAVFKFNDETSEYEIVR